MVGMRFHNETQNSNGANLGVENKLWEIADKLRGHIDASEYEYMVLGLIFLKYISDAFQAKYKQLEAAKETEYTDPEDRDEYARRQYLLGSKGCPLGQASGKRQAADHRQSR